MNGKKEMFRGYRLFLLGLILFAAVCMAGGAQKVLAASAGFQTIDGKTYYIDEDGEKHKGWLQIGTRRYYLNRKTGVLTTGWFTDSKGNQYYFSRSTGFALTGWQTYKNIKRYFNKKTGVMAVGWHTGSSGVRRYFDPETGDMYRNKTAVIDGVSYSFNSKGAATELKAQSEVPEETDLTITVYDSTNARYYTVMKEYQTAPGVADGTKSDLDLLAAVCECEAGNQGKIGMAAVALSVLNRTIDTSRCFPSTVRYVLYQGTTFAQYSVVTGSGFLKRLNGKFNNKTKAYAAAQLALDVFNAYVKNGTKRTLSKFKTKDFDYKYFMTVEAFWKQSLDFDKVDYVIYKNHVFFVDWISA